MKNRDRRSNSFTNLVFLTILLTCHRQLMPMDQPPSASSNPEPSEITILALPSDALGIIATWNLHNALHDSKDISTPAAVKRCSRTAGNFSVVCKRFAKTVSPLIKSEALMGMLTQKLAQRFDTPLRGALNCLNNQIARQWYEKVGRVRDLATLPEDLRVIVDLPNSNKAKTLWRESDDPQMLKHLVAAGVDTIEDKRDPHYTVTKLMRAASLGEVERVLLLVNMGANIEAKSGYRLDEATPLMFATLGFSHTCAQTVALLLKLDADINARGSSGETALMMAASCTKLEIVKILLAAGADVMAKDADMKTALSYAQKELKSKQKRSEKLTRSELGFLGCLLNSNPLDSQAIKWQQEIVNLLEQAEIASLTPEKRLVR